jgi:hypothetical protein
MNETKPSDTSTILRPDDPLWRFFGVLRGVLPRAAIGPSIQGTVRRAVRGVWARRDSEGALVE